jgi:hypothetical protein
MWWHYYDDYAGDIERELAATQKHLGFTTLRMFLHSQVFAADPQGLINNMDRFLTTASAHGMRAGFVFFDVSTCNQDYEATPALLTATNHVQDCWVQDGGNVTQPCVPTKGVHNGCWMSSPQTSERTSVDRFRPFVSEVIRAFKDDDRVVWWVSC